MRILLIFIFPLILFAQEKGYIDMHGGKKDNLINNKNGFSNSFSNQSPFGMKNVKTKEKKKEQKLKSKKENNK